MLLMKADKIQVEIDGKQILKDASMEIHQGDHIVLIGQNGVGKTTLVKALTGSIPITKGTIIDALEPYEKGYMAQTVDVDSQTTTRAFVESGNSALSELRAQLSNAAQMLESHPEQTGLYNELLQAYIDRDGYTWEAKVEKQLMQMGIEPNHWDQPLNTLSGGQKTRAQLARILVNEVKLLIMDEPTNHLDGETMAWLSQWIQKYKGAVLIISHDRAFIDQVAHLTYELTPEGTRKYKGGYKEYKAVKEEERRTLEATYKNQVQEQRKLEEAIQNYREWFNKAHQAAGERNPYAKKRANKNITRLQTKEKALGRLNQNKVEKPREEAEISVNFDDRSLSSRRLLSMEKVTFYYDEEKPLFNDISIFLEKEDRVAIIGPNGTGKTTFLNLIAGKLVPQKGCIQKHPKLEVGYFMQELNELPIQQTILDYVLTVPNLTQSEARTILACFLFRGDRVYQRIKDLSMGEKCRVAFVKLYFSGANLLVLDEPTNYLDITTREQIENALRLYPGALLIVSHDQYLVEKVANCIISLKDGFHYFPGNYKEWRESTQGDGLQHENQDEIQRLELLYAQTLSEEIPDTNEARARHLEKIRLIKQKIDFLNIKEQ